MSISGCDAKPYPRIQLLHGGDWYYVLDKPYNYTVVLWDPKLQTMLTHHECQTFNENIWLPDSPFISFKILNIQNFYKCSLTSSNTPNITQTNNHFAGYKMYNDCKGFSIYYKLPLYVDADILAHNLPANCSLIRLPIFSWDSDLFNLLRPKVLVEWKLSDDCNKCHYGGGQCQTDKTNIFQCHKDAKATRSKLGLTLGAAFDGVALVMISCSVVYFSWCYKKRKFSPSRFLLTKKFSDISKHDVEGGSIYLGVPVFSYSELEEATNDFNSSRVLGDGGFGTVYYGKLKDGREVAVKLLYEHNCKRMQQFVNEIEILTRLRHNNLVTLYGCTSWRSRELLLVYEYIPNGTLADHLHGDKAKDRSLVWSIRMNIAI